MKFHKLQFLFLINFLLIILLFFWVIGGNFLLKNSETLMQADWENFIHKIPKTETNDSGFKIISGTKNFNDFNHELNQNMIKYLESQNKKTALYFDSIPQNIEKYLKSNSVDIDSFVTEISPRDFPQFEFYPEYDHNNQPSFSFLGLVNLERNLILQGIRKYQAGQTQKALEIFNVAFYINESVHNYPTLIGQLVAIILDNHLIGVIRKLDQFPLEWSDKIHELIEKIPDNFLDGLLLEWFVNLRKLSMYPTWKIENFFDSQVRSEPPPFSPILDPVQQIYRRFSAAESWKIKESFRQLPTRNFCDFDIEQFRKEYFISSWWNAWDNSFGNVPLHWSKMLANLLHWELTDKIIQIKQLGSTQGKWPEKIPAIERSLCSDRHWVYQVLPDGGFSISYSQLPSWWSENPPLPLSYAHPAPPLLKGRTKQ